MVTIDLEALYALLGVEVQEPDDPVEEEPTSAVSAGPLHYVGLETETAIDEVWNDDENVPQRSDDHVECAFRNLRLAKENCRGRRKTIDGPGKKQNLSYVHVVNR